MTKTDNRTNEPNKYAGFIARQNHQRDPWRGIGKKCLCGVVFDSDVDHAMHQVDEILRAALVAAAGAAPQAESETIIGAVMRTSSMACHIALAADGMAESHGAGCGHVPILTPAVQQVSESDLAEVIREAKSSWLKACGTPGHVEDIDVWITRAVAAALGLTAGQEGKNDEHS